ncbi:hypothetical protein THIOM_001915 [Candidatus Thiomargarita nelsonii]|uniref:Uncharacterized protein n=1 Tax=Candidatus Thiomargarita nelsonii TaxID=1003181 RepID=A0A176S327_9GAMM|nr:hypothetical protein THIOM_001915 [Candidatus Thiomargarita nelsonii]
MDRWWCCGYSGRTSRCRCWFIFSRAYSPKAFGMEVRHIKAKFLKNAFHSFHKRRGATHKHMALLKIRGNRFYYLTVNPPF